MSQIRCIYTVEPGFPSSAQHPDAQRAFVDPYWVDYLGTPAPTLAEIQAALNPPPIDLSDIDNLDKVLKAVGLLMRDYCNQLKQGTYAGSGPGGTKTIADLKADFGAKYNALP